MSKHTYIENFNPGVEKMRSEHQDYLYDFNAGEGFENFNEFIKKEAIEYEEEGNGVTYLIFNYAVDEKDNISEKQLMAYYTIAATSIPYVDRIRLEEDEAQELGRDFDEMICGIPSAEIKMFAVDYKYQNLFYEYEGESLPISAWILRQIVNDCLSMITNVIGFKAIFLHSLPSAEKFYLKNGFFNIEEYMTPLYSVDKEFQAMYMSLRHIHVNQDI